MRRSGMLVMSRKELLPSPPTVLIGTTRSDYIRFYHLRAYDRINAPYGTSHPRCLSMPSY